MYIMLLLERTSMEKRHYFSCSHIDNIQKGCGGIGARTGGCSEDLLYGHDNRVQGQTQVCRWRIPIQTHPDAK